MRKNILVSILIFSIILCGNVYAEEDTNDLSFSIVQTNDIYGNIYSYDYYKDQKNEAVGFAKIATYMKLVREEGRPILIDIGNTVRDDADELIFDEETHPVINIMNDLMYDMWVFGEHELLYGWKTMKDDFESYNGDVVGTNLSDQFNIIQPYAIKSVNNISVGVMGITVPDSYILQFESSDIFYKDIEGSIKATVSEMKGKCDVVIGIFNLSEFQNVNLDNLYNEGTLKGMNIVISNYEEESYIEIKDEVKIIRLNNSEGSVYKLDFTLSNDYIVENVNMNMVSVENYEEDEIVLEHFKKTHNFINGKMGKGIGNNLRQFIYFVDYIVSGNEVVTMPTAHLQDTAISDFINEVQLFYTDADVSATEIFDYNSNLKRGAFETKDILNLYSKPYTLYGVTMNGQQLLKYMNRSANYYNTYIKGDLSISFNEAYQREDYDMFSGVSYDVDISAEPGNRIANVYIKGEPINLNAYYKIAINSHTYLELSRRGLIDSDSIYFSSADVYSDSENSKIRNLLIKYIEEIRQGIIRPVVDYNWKIIGTDIDEDLQRELFDLIIKRELMVPTSNDEKLLNVRSLTTEDLLRYKGIAIDEYSNYVVKYGDNLYKIALKHNTTWPVLAEINNLKNPNLIIVGQILKVTK